MVKTSKLLNKRKIFIVSLLLIIFIALLMFWGNRYLRSSVYRSAVRAYSLQHSNEELINIPMNPAPYRSHFWDKLNGDSNLNIYLVSQDETRYYAHAFLFFKPELLNNLTLEGFRQNSLSEEANININFYEKTIPGGGAAVVWSRSPKTIKNVQIYFDSFERQMLKGRVEFDVPSLRFSFSKNASPAGCIDPGMTPGGYDLCFEDHYASVNIKVSMPFEIQAN